MLKQAPFTLAALAVVGFVSCSVAVGQDSAAKPKSLADEYIVGNWNAEGTVDGKAVTGSMRVWPAAGGMCLIYKWSYGSSAKDMVRGISLGGRDLQTTDYLEYCFDSDGSHIINRFPGAPFPDTGVGYGERTGTIQGKPYKGKITVDRKGRDEFLFTVASEHGEDVKFTFRRVRDERVVSPVYEHLKDLEDYVGTWVAEDTLNQDMPGLGAKKGARVSYSVSPRWNQNKAILEMDFVITAADGKPVDGSWYFGWDAVDKKITFSGFASNGGRDWGTLKKESPDKWVWEWNWCSPDGVKGTARDTTTMLDNNSTHVHQYTNTVFDGQPQPDRKLVYKRVK